MDFGTLLTVAQKNGTTSKQPTACYQTKFAPPKKQSKQTKSLSNNIKKFLARKEEEERRKSLEEKQKREKLLALRDHKTQTRINKHLKVCKAANKSVLADAVDNENTALTIAGPSQPDEDDYGYVSQEASAFYNQLIRKYTNAPPEKPLFASTTKRSTKDIATTKDRVKQALRQQELEEALGHRKRRKKEAEPVPVEKAKEVQPVKRKSAPAPIGFGELLKIAEVKQHEPIVIQAKPKIEEPERLMTKRQMKEFAKEKEWRERKESREKPGKPNSKTHKSSILKQALVKSGRPKLESTMTAKVVKKEQETLAEERKMLEAEKKKIEEMRKALEEERKKLEESKDKKIKVTKPKQSEKQSTAKPMRVNLGKKPPATKPLKSRSQSSPRVPLTDMEEEYDSELDDFIDDAAEEASEDYSKYISEIFGYDKSKYRNLETGDDDAMESSFAQQLKEEYVSTKIGIMEDLEDIRMEALEKKKKALMRKKIK